MTERDPIEEWARDRWFVPGQPYPRGCRTEDMAEMPRIPIKVLKICSQCDHDDCPGQNRKEED